MGATVFFESASEFATLTNTFSVGATPTDPTAVTLVVTPPSGTATTYTWPSPETITKSSTGVFTRDVACSEDGVWQYVWTGTGAVADVVAGTWTVYGTELQRLYCTPAELKSRTGISDTLDDFEILAACQAVSRWIDNHCDRRFYRATETRYYTPTCAYSLDVDDLVSVTTLSSDPGQDGTYETTWASTDYQLLPLNATAKGRPYTSLGAVGGQSFPLTTRRQGSVQLVGVFGWPSIPPEVKQAAAIMSNDYLKLGGMAFGVQGYAEYGLVRARNSGPAMDLLAPYRRYPLLVA